MKKRMFAEILQENFKSEAALMLEVSSEWEEV
jgi:hypothetical protein